MKATCLMRAAKAMANTQHAEGMKCRYPPTQSFYGEYRGPVPYVWRVIAFLCCISFIQLREIGESDKLIKVNCF